MNYKLKLNPLFIFFLSIFCLFISNAQAQTCSTAPNNLVSWWRGEGNALDQKALNNGTLQNGTTFAAGRVGRAFSFDGVDDFVDVPDSASLDVSTAMTIDAWVFPTQIKNQRVITKWGTGGFRTFTVDFGSDAGVAIVVSSDGNNFPSVSTPAGDVPLNQWTHIAVVFQGGSFLKIYINGVERANSGSAPSSIFNSTSPFRLGRNFNDAPGGLNYSGLLDEVGIYNRALNQSEIASIYNAGAAGKCLATPAPIGLAEWWTADDNALGVRNRNNGSLQNGANYASGKVGQAFSFDGNNDYVNVQKTNTLNFGTDDFSVEFWVKWNNVGTGGIISGDNFGAAGDYNGWLFNDDGNSGGIGLLTRKASVGNANARIATSNFTSGVWYHLAGVRTGRTLQLYVNGVLSASGTENAAIDVSNNYEIRIGSLSASAPQFFNGQVDEPALYNRALTAGEVLAIFNAGSAGKSKPTATTAPTDQVAWLAGDGNANDFTGTNNGTLQNGAGYAVGKVGQAFSFDGVDDYVEVPDNPSLNMTNAVTVEAWINLSTLPAVWADIITKDEPAEGPYTLRLKNDGAVSFIVRTADGFHEISSPTGAANAGVFSHIAGTYNASSQSFCVYVNAVSSCTTLSSGALVPNNNALKIGVDIFNGRYFNGLIDEPSIYNRDLTQVEITSIFNAAQAGKLKQTTTTGTTATVGDVTLTYANAATRQTQVVPLNENDFPALPVGMTSTGLIYDISTDALPAGTTSICFNLPSFVSLTQTEFNERRVLHLENGAWNFNLLTTRNFAAKTICVTVSSLSPFAIVDSNLTPTAATVSISGRVMTSSGMGISKAVVAITDESGNTRTVLTNPFGYYQFTDVSVGETYLLSVKGKRHRFQGDVRLLSVTGDMEEINFIAIDD